MGQLRHVRATEGHDRCRYRNKTKKKSLRRLNQGFHQSCASPGHVTNLTSLEDALHPLNMTIRLCSAVLGTVLLVIAWPYGLSMIVRYVGRMWRHPDARWTGRTIPIVRLVAA